MGHEGPKLAQGQLKTSQHMNVYIYLCIYIYIYVDGRVAFAWCERPLRTEQRCERSVLHVSFSRLNGLGDLLPNWDTMEPK